MYQTKIDFGGIHKPCLVLLVILLFLYVDDVYNRGLVRSRAFLQGMTSSGQGKV